MLTWRGGGAKRELWTLEHPDEHQLLYKLTSDVVFIILCVSIISLSSLLVGDSLAPPSLCFLSGSLDGVHMKR